MHLPLSFKDRRAFTLVELLITVSIIAIITGATVPAFSVYLKNQNLKQGKEQLKSDLKSIQNRAMTGVYSDQLVSGNPIAYWGVKFISGARTYSYFITNSNTACPAVLPVVAAVSLPVTMNLPEGITFTRTRCLFFDIDDGAIVSCLDSICSVLPGTVDLTDGASTLSVSYNNAGRIAN